MLKLGVVTAKFWTKSFCCVSAMFWFSHRIAGEQRCRHQVRNNCGEIMLQAHKHSPAATQHRWEHWGTRSTQILHVIFPGKTMERSWPMMMGAEQLWLYWLRSNNKVGSDKRRWRGLLIVNCTCNLLAAEHTLDCDSMLVLMCDVWLEAGISTNDNGNIRKVLLYLHLHKTAFPFNPGKVFKQWILWQLEFFLKKDKLPISD